MKLRRTKMVPIFGGHPADNDVASDWRRMCLARSRNQILYTIHLCPCWPLLLHCVICQIGCCCKKTSGTISIRCLSATRSYRGRTERRSKPRHQQDGHDRRQRPCRRIAIKTRSLPTAEEIGDRVEAGDSGQRPGNWDKAGRTVLSTP